MSHKVERDLQTLVCRAPSPVYVLFKRLERRRPRAFGALVLVLSVVAVVVVV
jgi:hypothetical protein